MTAGRGTDGRNRESSDEEKAKNPKPQTKLLTNISEDENSITAFFVSKYAEHNDSTITNKLGFTNSNYYSIKNPALTTVEDNSIEFCVYCYNVQPDINIDYETGASSYSAQPTADENKIYRTPTGKKYHFDKECGGKNSFETTLEEAKQAGLEPCSKCVK